MTTTSITLSFSATGFFSKLVDDYISADEKLLPFYEHPVNLDGIKAAISQRKKFNTNRQLLVKNLQKKYASANLTAQQQINIELLLKDTTFTVTTAHQPNIFTGHLYFIYKILHAVKLANHLAAQLPDSNFVPVYYMGSEDADLDELGHIFIDGEKYEWKTNQTGAVGRMKVDKALVSLTEQFSGQLLVLPYGQEIVDLMRSCYTVGSTIEQATFKLVNGLFASFGLLILLPDDAELKNEFAPLIARELTEQFSHKVVTATLENFPKEYKVQTSGREINMFYLQEKSRERIELVSSSANPGEREFAIVNSDKKFTQEALLNELKEHPEAFSPNVILRPVLQETILPNIAFIGGGGEIAYWLELKKVFEAAGVPYPVLVVRNSFLVVEHKYRQLVEKLHFSYTDIFKKEFDLLNDLVKRDSVLQTDLAKETEQFIALYRQVKKIAGRIDTTLEPHTEALSVKALKKITALEKKMLRAEKLKFEAQQLQLTKLKRQLFPNNSLQERVENFMGLYAIYGAGFIQALYDNSLSLEQEFTVLLEAQKQ